jgi:divalent metal cation (Fe/Co/Zn/Cd) transporter
MTLGEAHNLVERLEAEMHQRVPEIKEVHTHIEMADRRVQEGDRAPEELEQRVRQEIQRIVDSIPTLNFPHNIVVRQNRGEGGGYYVALECTVAADTPVADAHQLSTQLERELSEHVDGVVDVFVHLEPPGST